MSVLLVQQRNSRTIFIQEVIDSNYLRSNFIMMHVYSFFVNRVVALWNSLPDEYVALTSESSFKNQLDIHWSQVEVLI